MTTLSSTMPLFEPTPVSEKPMEGIVKCMVIGDGGVGKTSLIMRYCTGDSPPDYRIPYLYTEALGPTPHTIEGFDFKLVIFDTGGGEDYDRLRPLSYPMTDIFILCFSLVNPASFRRVRHHYAPEISQLNPTTPVLLVGTKVDLRDSHAGVGKKGEVSPISHRDGLNLSREIKAAAYMECSALTDFNVTAIFDQAMRLSLSPTFKTPEKRRWSRSCVIA